MNRKLPYNPKLKERAKYLRNNSTLGEVLLWKELKGKQMMGFDFNRQKPIDNYIADFFCMKLRLVIEIDGASHNFQAEYDLKRQRNLEKLGLTVLRFTEKEVRRDIQNVLRSIAMWIEGKTPHPA